jgi:hypothetical protein
MTSEMLSNTWEMTSEMRETTSETREMTSHTTQTIFARRMTTFGGSLRPTSGITPIRERLTRPQFGRAEGAAPESVLATSLRPKHRRRIRTPRPARR